MEKNRKKGQNGKGDSRRPMDVSREEFEKNWDLLFGKKDKDNDKKNKGV